MATNTTSPNMTLIIPAVGQESGPTYAFDINNDLSIIDQHDHSSGKGVQITPAGMNINAALTFNNNRATALAGLTLTPQLSTPANVTIYSAGTDLYFVDGLGNNVRITQSGGIAGSPGSISNLNSPASASYVSGAQTFVWQSGSGIAANMDFGSALLRNLSPNSTFALTLSPPSALGANYTLTLPSLPSGASFMTLDSSGNMSSMLQTANFVATGNIQAQAVTSAKIANNTITTAQISTTAGILGSQLSATAGILSAQINDVNGAIIDQGTVLVSAMADIAENPFGGYTNPGSFGQSGNMNGSTSSGTVSNSTTNYMQLVDTRPFLISLAPTSFSSGASGVIRVGSNSVTMTIKVLSIGGGTFATYRYDLDANSVYASGAFNINSYWSAGGGSFTRQFAVHIEVTNSVTFENITLTAMQF